MSDLRLPYTHAYFLGIGGIGMSALSQFMHHQGIKVSGYDKTPSSVTDHLSKLGIPCFFDEDTERINQMFSGVPRDRILVVYTPAVPPEHQEYQWFIQQGYTIRKRAEILGLISRYFRTIAVAGSHGKTTTTTWLTHLLYTAGMNVLSFMGGISRNYGTNLLLPEKGLTKETWMIAEADEYDRSFLQMHPYFTVITSTDPDHLDVYSNEADFKKTFQEFAALTQSWLLVNKNVENEFNFFEKRYTYSINLMSTCFIRSLQIENGKSIFRAEVEGEGYPEMKIGLPGLHNLENLLPGFLLSRILGISPDCVKRAVESFRGVARRFDIRVEHPECLYVDDYAHHPTEIRATLTAVRKYFPGKKLRVIFQPHLFSRTRDFLEDFARSLSLSDEVWLMDIYPAREKPIPGVSAALLLEKISCAEKKLIRKEELVQEVLKDPKGVWITMGAGDIDRIVPDMEQALKAHWKI